MQPQDDAPTPIETTPEQPGPEHPAPEQIDEATEAQQTPDVEPSGLPVKVILKPRKAQPFFGRHPWVFETAIEALETDDGEEPAVGSVVELFSAKDEFIAWGLWNSASGIRVRLYSWDRERPFDADLIRNRIANAVALRKAQFDLASDSCGCRIIFSESDFLSGLTVDSYGGYLIVMFTSAALFQFKDVVLAELQQQLNPQGIWLRTEKGTREAEGLDVHDGLISGKEPPRPLFIQEGKIRYGVDVQEGQKTGCYLDQRNNRLVAAKYAKGRMLDTFCFSGGFGITALVEGTAKAVLAVDSSDGALNMALGNCELNEVADRYRTERSDVRAFLEAAVERKDSFDTIVLDPPKMARTRGGLKRALKGYEKLNRLAVQLLPPGGILITCSCSGLVSAEQFREVVADVARSEKRDIQFLEQHGQPADHPVSSTCPQTAYLKMLVCRVA